MKKVEKVTISLCMLLFVLLLLAALLPQLSLSKPTNEKRQPRKNIRNLTVFIYRYLNVLKVPYVECILHCLERVYPWA